MKSKWLEFRLQGKKNKTFVWTVHNYKNGEYLGIIKWYSQWRQYCYIPFKSLFQDELVFSQSCLRDIAEFIKEQMDERKIRQVRAKSISKVSRKEARKAVIKISLCSYCFCMTKTINGKCGKCKKKKRIK